MEAEALAERCVLKHSAGCPWKFAGGRLPSPWDVVSVIMVSIACLFFRCRYPRFLKNHFGSSEIRTQALALLARSPHHRPLAHILWSRWPRLGCKFSKVTLKGNQTWKFLALRKPSQLALFRDKTKCMTRPDMCQSLKCWAITTH